MGTRSLTHIHNENDGKILLTFYNQFDGYPDGWGKELAEFLSGFVVVNGLSGDTGKIANGMGCLAAQIIANFKDEPGQFYVYPADSKNCGEEYVYHVRVGPECMVGQEGVRWPRAVRRIVLTCSEDRSGGKGGPTLFEGDPASFPDFLAIRANQEP